MSIPELSEKVMDGHMGFCVRKYLLRPQRNDTSKERFSLIKEQNDNEEHFLKKIQLQLTVTDTGIGIPNKDQGGLFKLFGKTSSNHDRNKTG
mmetsp:Transcript_2418/g.2091  ORF Transcript_2418/g.2091 Transcript_2418/m.2091 type:complete len:92 (-) Transcript_2418:121-396(-)